MFLPTKATMLLKALLQARPNHHLIMADFAQLPDVQIPGRNAPLVTAMVRLLRCPNTWAIPANIKAGVLHNEPENRHCTFLHSV